MPLYEITSDRLRALDTTTFHAAQVKERTDLQRLFRDQIEIIAPGVLVIAEEFGNWEDSRRRIDLLGIDKQASLVVIELKRTEDGGHMELQAIRYAAMVSNMTFEQAIETYQSFLKSHNIDKDARSELLKHLDWDEPEEDNFAQDVRIILAAADFSSEVTSAVLWLGERNVDISCIRLRPYADGERVLLDVQRVIPLPEAENYQVRLKDKQQKERVEKSRSKRDYTKLDITTPKGTFTRLNKGQSVFTIISELCSQGVTPRQIIDAVPFRRTNCFTIVPGEIIDEDLFNAKATELAEAQGKRFDDWRFFTSTDELITAEGHTYAISKQWGGRAIEWIEHLLKAFPDSGIKIRENTES